MTAHIDLNVNREGSIATKTSTVPDKTIARRCSGPIGLPNQTGCDDPTGKADRSQQCLVTAQSCNQCPTTSCGPEVATLSPTTIHAGSRSAEHPPSGLFRWSRLVFVAGKVAYASAMDAETDSETTLHRRCVERPPETPSCPSWAQGQVCSLAAQSCDQSAFTSSIDTASVPSQTVTKSAASRSFGAPIPS